MNLYEATNGWIGESYVRAIVIAENEEQALALAKDSFRKESDPTHPEFKKAWKSAYPSRYWENVSVSLVREGLETPWASEPSDG